MSNFTTSPRLFHMLLAPLEPLLPKAIQHYQADYRCHKFEAAPHLRLSLFAHLEQSPSGRALVEELNDTGGAGHDRNLRQMIGFDEFEFGLPVTINQSSFSRANQEHDFRVWRQCFHRLWPLVKKQVHHRELAGLGKILLVDGSFFECMHQMFWAVYSATCNKVKGHFFYDLDGLPEKLVLTDGKGNEKKVLHQQLKPLVTYIVDRGYDEYQLYRDIIKQHAHVVTRLKKSASFAVLEPRVVPVDQVMLGVTADATVRLGSGDNTVDLRLVSYRDRDGQEWQYLTTRSDLTAYTIVELYAHRWQIELFFGWIKRHLQLGHWYSYDKNGVLIQLYAAMIVFLLLKLFSALSDKTHFKGMHIDFVRWVRRHLFDQIAEADIIAYLQLLPVINNQIKT